MATEGTFLVAAADESAPVLRDVRDGQVLTLAEPPDLPDGPLEAGEVVEGTLVPASPAAVTWQLEAVADRWTVTVERTAEPPTALARDLAADVDVGAVARRDRAGAGALHVLAVPDGEADSAAADVAGDRATLERAGRLGVSRVEIREGTGLVSVRYLP